MAKIRIKTKVNVQKSDTTRTDTVRIQSQVQAKNDSIPRAENPKLEVQPHDNNTQIGRIKFGERSDSIRKDTVTIKIKRR